MPRKVLIRPRRGTHSNLPNSGMVEGELLVTTDRHNPWLAKDASTRVPLTPAIGDLPLMGAVDPTADKLIIHDADATGVKEKQISVQDLKAALNIPEASTDEKVAVVPGGPAGYLWGTTGNDGVLRTGSSLSMTKAADNSHIVLDVLEIDGGTF